MTAKTLVARPTARQVPTAGHVTLRSWSLKVPFKLGPAVAVQAEPFQVSMRVAPMLPLRPVDPTAVHWVVLEQATDESTGSTAVAGAVGTDVHAVPFHTSLSAREPFAEPTAMQKFHATHDTPASCPTPDGVGTVLAVQPFPFQRSATGETMLPLVALPTAMQTLRLAHDVAARLLPVDPGLEGGGVSCHPVVVKAPAGAGGLSSGRATDVPRMASTITTARQRFRVQRRILALPPFRLPAPASRGCRVNEAE